MKRLAFAVGLLALGFTASTRRAPTSPWFGWITAGARLVGQRRYPVGVGWTKIAIGLPDWLAASATLDMARSQGTCG